MLQPHPHIFHIYIYFNVNEKKYYYFKCENNSYPQSKHILNIDQRFRNNSNKIVFILRYINNMFRYHWQHSNSIHLENHCRFETEWKGNSKINNVSVVLYIFIFFIYIIIVNYYYYYFFLFIFLMLSFACSTACSCSSGPCSHIIIIIIIKIFHNLPHILVLLLYILHHYQ